MRRFSAFIFSMLFMTMCSTAAADRYDILKPMWLNALENMQEQKAEAVPLERREPKIVSGDDQLEVVRYAVHMDDEYSPEAYVYAQLRNTGNSVIRLNGAALSVLDASGRQIAREEYASVKPDVVMPGGTVYVSEWLYDFVNDISRVGSFEIAVERSEYGRKQIEMIEGSRAYIEGDYLYAEVHNASDEPLFKAGVTAVVTDANGRILDILQEESYSNLGIAPGSTVIFRKRISQYAADAVNAVCEAYGFAYSE